MLSTHRDTILLVKYPKSIVIMCITLHSGHSTNCLAVQTVCLIQGSKA